MVMSTTREAKQIQNKKDKVVKSWKNIRKVEIVAAHSMPLCCLLYSLAINGLYFYFLKKRLCLRQSNDQGLRLRRNTLPRSSSRRLCPWSSFLLFVITNKTGYFNSSVWRQLLFDHTHWIRVSYHNCTQTNIHRITNNIASSELTDAYTLFDFSNGYTIETGGFANCLFDTVQVMPPHQN